MTAERAADPKAWGAFAPATRAWFSDAFPGGPTAVQDRAWAAIGRGESTLVIAPTGSGKTLAAFLSAIDRLIGGTVPTEETTARSRSERTRPGDATAVGTHVDGSGRTDDGAPAPVRPTFADRSTGAARAKHRGVRILYISPLKALGTDVERNLRRPLAGITEAAARLGTPVRPVSVGVRSGDTPASERRRLGARPPDILITTPESLYLMLTSAVRETLCTVETVIVDEIHSFAGEKRGSHLALSLERLDNLLERPAQRIGLSATVAPREEIARFLGGTHPVAVIADDGRTAPEVTVAVPVEDMAHVPATADRRTRMERAVAGSRRRPPDPSRAWRSDRALRRALAADAVAGPGAVGAERVFGRATAPGPIAGIGGPPGSSAGAAFGVGGAAGLAASGQRAADGPGAPPPSGAVDPPGPGTPSAPPTVQSARTGAAPPAAQVSGSIWPHLEEAILDAVLAHRGTLVFVNSRGVCERLTAHLNEAYTMRVLPGGPGTAPEPAMHRESWEMGDANHAQGLPEAAPVIAKAHHGSVSKEQRLAVERELKSGELRCVVATASLELGIDMGSIDLVIQVAPPPSVASGLQRVGRADHHVGGRPRGTIYPVQRTQLIDAAVAAEGMRAGAIESTALVSNALDVLAQQTVAAASLEDLEVEAWYRTVRRAAPYRDLPRGAYDSVLELLTGGYSSAELADLSPRLTWDRRAGTLTARPGAQRLAVTASGTIPDRGTFPVLLPEGAQDGGRRRVGELDEEMVNETSVGDVITLGTTSWRVREITGDRVVVDPAPGRSSRLPFWRGDGPGRPAGTGSARGAFLREAAAGLDDAAAWPGAPAPAPALISRLTAAGLDEWARANLVALLLEQRRATGVVPSDTTLVLERNEDQAGSLRLILHSPFGRRVHEPWAMAIRERVRATMGLEPQLVVADDGIVLQVPATEGPPPGAELVVFDAEELTRLVRSRIGETALFASRFRECAVRALLMPRSEPGRRTPLWLQRIKSGQLLESARQFPDFPVLVEAARECLQDVYDLEALASLMGRLAAGTVRVVEVTTPAPSPLAAPLLFGYTAALLYQEDLPHAERQAHLLSLDPDAVAALLGDDATAELLDDDVLSQVEAEIQRLTPRRRARADAEGLSDLLRELGPLTVAELAARCRGPRGGAVAGPAEPDAAAAPDATGAAVGPGTAGAAAVGPGTASPAGSVGAVGEEVVVASAGHADKATVRAALDELERAQRALPVRLGARSCWVRAEDAPVLHETLGAAVPDWARERGDGPRRAVDRSALEGLVLRHARTHAVVRAGEVAAAFGLGAAVAEDALDHLEAGGRLVRLGGRGGDERWMAPEVLRRVRSRSLARARQAAQPVSPHALQRLVLTRAGLAEPRTGIDALADAIAALEGVWLPTAQWEEQVLPARVTDYQPDMLDELIASGDIIWQARTSTAPAEAPGELGADASSAVPGPVPAPGPDSTSLVPEEIAFFPSDSPMAPLVGEPLDVEALTADHAWRLTLSGLATARSFEPVRRSVAPRPTVALQRRVRSRRGRGRYAGLLGQRSLAAPTDRTSPTSWGVTGPAVGTSTADPAVGPSTAGPAVGPRDAAAAAFGAVGMGPAAGSARGRATAGGTREGVGVGLFVTGAVWHRLEEPHVSEVEAALASVESLMDRFGLITPDLALAAGIPGGFGRLQPLLRRMEDTGALMRGHFVEGLGPAQLAERETVEALRALDAQGGADPGTDARDGSGHGAGTRDGAGREARDRGVPDRGADDRDGAGRGSYVVVDLKDPACLVGRGVPWPEPALPPELQRRQGSHTPPASARRAGTSVVLLDGRPVLYSAENMRVLVSYTAEPCELKTALHALIAAQRRAMTRQGEGSVRRRLVESLNGIPAIDRAVSELLAGAGLARDPRGMRLAVDPFGRARMGP